MKRFILTLLTALALFQLPSFACTSVIVSGKATPDGRPLMWKNRDTGNKENHVMHFPATDGCYSFVALVNSPSKNPHSIWIGTNSEGFSIMNTQSYNITAEQDKDKDDDNGGFMKRALEKCASIEDFEKYLSELPKPWNVSANIGVIDAKGGAAYYEINYTEYFKFDANETEEGYLIRTNYSLNGRPVTEGRGCVRYMEAEKMMKEAYEFTPDFIFDKLSRNWANPLLGFDYRSPEYKNEWALEFDTITRYNTTCSVVVQGVRSGENPSLTTMWTIVGYPGTTVALPVWECAGEEGLPKSLRRGEDGLSPLSHYGYILKQKVYCFDLDDAEINQRYFKWSLLWNEDGSGYLQMVQALENELLYGYKIALKKWYEAGKPDMEELSRLNKASDERIETVYSANI